jgi:hypothetical protein
MTRPRQLPERVGRQSQELRTNERPSKRKVISGNGETPVAIEAVQRTNLLFSSGHRVQFRDAAPGVFGLKT